MGMLDSMFGGGTKLTMTLDTPQASAGGVVGGKITLQGGKKPLKLTELTVKLLFVSVHSREGQSLPDIKTEILLTQTVAAGEDLAPEAVKNFAFRFTVPHGTETSAHNVSYTVMAAADIPGVKDPSDSKELKVVDASDDEFRLLPIEEIFSRYAGLRSQQEHEVEEALNDLFIACYSEGSQLMEIEPYLSHLMAQGTINVRRAALTAWANLVDNRVKPQHLQTLYAVANIPGLDQATFDQVIVAACKFAEEGAYQLVQQLAQAGDAHIRREVASGLRFHSADKFNGKRELLIALTQDADPQVRAAAIGGFSSYRDDQQIMHGVANQADRDPSAEVQAACMSTLAFAHHYGMGELTLAVFDKHVANPNREVKKEIASSLHCLPKEAFQRIWGLASRLIADQDEEVRRAMAFQFCNLEELPQLLPLAQQAAQQDPSAEVRYECIGSMAVMMRPEQAAQLYGQLLTQDGSSDMAWAVLNGLRRHAEHPAAKKMLTQLTQSHYEGVADAARDALTR